ncbi:MAG: hypothetical protein HY648_09035 [Acidobacteria bacterium]|nr:hypothetical protein [Acidobacteriota bacterium]
MSAEPELVTAEGTPNRKKTLLVVLGTILAALAVWGFFLFLWPKNPATALLRYLPEGADLYIVADLEALRSNLAVKRWLEGPSSFAAEQEYEEFVKATGFRYQRDLQQMALGKIGADWYGAARLRLDRARVTEHLESRRDGKSQSGDLTIYRFGQVRPFRLALLPGDLAIFTVGSNEESIQQMLQRHQRPLDDSAAAEMERAVSSGHLSERNGLQMLGKMEPWLNSSDPEPHLRMLEIAKAFLKGSQRFYGSVNSGLTWLDFRIEMECHSPEDAQRIAQSSQMLLRLLESAPPAGSQAADYNLPALLAGISVRQAEASAYLEWRWDRETLRLLEQNSQ